MHLLGLVALLLVVHVGGDLRPCAAVQASAIGTNELLICKEEKILSTNFILILSKVSIMFKQYIQRGAIGTNELLICKEGKSSKPYV